MQKETSIPTLTVLTMEKKDVAVFLCNDTNMSSSICCAITPQQAQRYQPALQCTVCTDSHGKAMKTYKMGFVKSQLFASELVPCWRMVPSALTG